MRFGFVTCVRLGLECMEEIYAAGGTLDLVLTLPDDMARGKSGRVYVDPFCRARGIPVVKVRNVNDDAAVDAIRAAGLDWLFIIGWSQIARPAVLHAPHRGVLGIHPTLLPEGRGRAAIPWAILKGLTRTGVTLFQLDEGVDTGPVLAQEAVEVAPDETATSLYERMGAAHRHLIRTTWPDLAAGRLQPVPQDESRATLWPVRRPEDGLIRPGMTVAEAERLVRAVTRPYPGAFVVEDDAVVRIWRGEVGDAGTAPPPGAHRIALADGVYDALEHEREPLPASVAALDPFAAPARAG
jgi:methionyl-tRNA formyltransferase